MAFINVIKYQGDNQMFIWKYPKQNFNLGSQLIVNESQEAIFILNGRVLDTFGPGKHTLTTENIPIVKSLIKFGTGGKSPFTAELYFVNKTEHMAIKWGTDSKIQYLDPIYNFPLELGACGQMSFSISNSTKLLVKLVGTERQLSKEQLIKYFKSFVMNRVKSMLTKAIMEQKIDIFTIDQHLNDLSKQLQVQLQDDFYDYGVDLKSFLITTVLKPDDNPNYLKFKNLYSRKHLDVVEAKLKQKLSIIEEQTKAQRTVIESQALAQKREIEGYTYQQEQSFEVAKEIARNEAVGEYGNVGIGLGMMSGVGSQLAQQVGAIAGIAFNSDTNSKLQFCKNCGYQFTSNGNFCPNCGIKRE